MAERQKKESGFTLKIPLDASGIDNFKPEQSIRIVAQARDGSTQSTVVKLDAKGKGTASFTFEDKPGGLRFAIGPEIASEEEVLGMQTINFDLSSRQWLDKRVLTIEPILISPYYWYWWLYWCRKFTIRGRVVCSNGNPVPGAKVCAYDIDCFFPSISKELVGCATTDINGAFEIKFNWCCGWWPWWWWQHRVWEFEPILVDRILSLIRDKLSIVNPPIPSPKPDLSVFADLLREEPTIRFPSTISEAQSKTLISESINPAISLQDTTNFKPEILDQLRPALLERLPALQEFETLRIWPWYPWHPWWDCTPDIIFKVTQECGREVNVIVDENIFNTRWDIPTEYNVTLVANSEACCIEPDNTPDGDCVVIARACNHQVNHIGGNTDAPATPRGYVNPGAVATDGDRPFAGTVHIYGVFGDLTSVDYYEVEWSDNSGVTWNPMFEGGFSGFTRWYYEGGFQPAPFPMVKIDGHSVIESREHFEADHGAKLWTSGRDRLVNWHTLNHFADGTYDLRVKTWQLDAGGHLIEGKILPLCDTENDNNLVLTIDNRFVGPPIPNSVHLNTVEPNTDFFAVRIVHNDRTITNLAACEGDTINDTDILEVDFMAYDPDGHLAYYTLNATYDENKINHLLNHLSNPSVQLTPLTTGGSVPAAIQVGPSYAKARSSNPAPDGGATAPIWHGGALRLRIPAKLAFPKTCCYQLELIAHKRTIVNCNDSLWSHSNFSHYTFMITVE